MNENMEAELDRMRRENEELRMAAGVRESVALKNTRLDAFTIVRMLDERDSLRTQLDAANARLAKVVAVLNDYERRNVVGGVLHLAGDIHAAIAGHTSAEQPGDAGKVIRVARDMQPCRPRR